MKLYDTNYYGGNPKGDPATGGANWSTFDAKSYTDTQIGNRDAQRTGAGTVVGGAGKGNYSGGFLGTSWGAKESTYSVVGINVNEVDNMREAIRVYVQAIKDHLNGIEPLATADNAFKSEEVQKAVQDYITKVKEYCMNLVSQLLAFSDKLADVKNAWQANMDALAGNTSSSASSLDQGTAYQETLS